jgi:hypothetical protein
VAISWEAALAAFVPRGDVLELRVARAPGRRNSYVPEQLERELCELGWRIQVTATSGPFFWGEGALAGAA